MRLCFPSCTDYMYASSRDNRVAFAWPNAGTMASSIKPCVTYRNANKGRQTAGSVLNFFCEILAFYI